MDSKASKKTSTAPPTMGNKKAKKSSTTVSAKEPQMYAVKDAFHKTAYTKKLNSHVDLPLIERAKLEGGAAQTLRDAERRNPKKTIGSRDTFSGQEKKRGQETPRRFRYPRSRSGRRRKRLRGGNALSKRETKRRRIDHAHIRWWSSWSWSRPRRRERKRGRKRKRETMMMRTRVLV